MKTRVALLAILISTTVFAVNTSHWTHTSEADFKAGTFHNVVATNLGDLKLSRAVKTILGLNEHISAVHALAETDGTIYAGTGPEGVLLAVENDKAETIANLGDGLNIFSLLIDSKGRLLIGASGEKGGIYRIDKPSEKTDDKPTQIFSETGVQYIWSMCQTPDGKIYAATGPNGQLFEIEEDGSHKLVFDSEQNNLTSMVSDGKDMLFVGTDPDGLIYRINRKTGEMFVLFDAPEPEISALVLDKDGTLYAGTTAAAEVQPDKGEDKGASDQVGRPEGSTGGVSIPTQPPDAPKPPQPPTPTPGQPAPIPKHAVSEPKHLLILADDPPDQPDPGEQPGLGGPAQPNKKPQAAATAAAQAQNLAAKTAQGVTTPASTGNAIYRIDKDGFVTEIFRQPVVVYSIVEQNGALLVGTGGEGMVYQVNPEAEETVVLAKVDPKEVISLLPTHDGRVILGLANAGDIAVMTKGFASDGTYTSAVLDATQISRFGKLQLHGTLPKETKLTVATRSSNVGEDSDRGWSDWSAEQPAVEFLPVQSPAARYLQYRLTFSSPDGKESPVVDDVDVAYQIPNLAPTIKTVKVAPKTPDAPPDPTAAGTAKTPPDHSVQTITWEGADPNTDPLQYSISFRAGAGSPWILLKDKLTEATWDWDTRSVADGHYEIKVTASDESANPLGLGKTASRVSDPLVVDNTPPVIGDLTASVKGTAAHIELRAVDRTSTIAALDYSIDSGTDWQSVLPSDNIADSPDEAYRFDTRPLGSGAHQITLRATDAHGNQTHESVTVTVEAPTASR